MNYKLKLVCGYRRDQEHSIDAQEAHKAYYLFLNPTSRGIFNNGLAIKGDQIQEIVPDYQGTMGWNATHTLDSDDWNEIRAKGVDKKIQKYLQDGKTIAYRNDPKLMNVPMSEIITEKKPEVLTSGVRELAQKMRVD